MDGVHISLKAEKVFELFGLGVTNSILTTWIVMLILVVFAFLLTRKISIIPTNAQVLAEMIVGGIYSLFESVTHEKTRIFYPLLATLFIFISALNWFGLVPGVGTINIKAPEENIMEQHSEINQSLIKKVNAASHNEKQVHNDSMEMEDKHEEEALHDQDAVKEHHAEMIPLFRAGTADLNTTLAFAIVAVVAIQYFGIKTLGGEYIGRFINFKNPIYFFVGILELMSEGTKIISFAFRLFGNIFAGEVLLTVVAFLMPLFAPLPFLALELFVGLIQALVFSMLTAVFLMLATSHQDH